MQLAALIEGSTLPRKVEYKYIFLNTAASVRSALCSNSVCFSFSARILKLSHLPQTTENQKGQCYNL